MDHDSSFVFDLDACVMCLAICSFLRTLIIIISTFVLTVLSPICLVNIHLDTVFLKFCLLLRQLFLPLGSILVGLFVVFLSQLPLYLFPLAILILLLYFLLHHPDPLILPPTTLFVNMELAASRAC